MLAPVESLMTGGAVAPAGTCSVAVSPADNCVAYSRDFAGVRRLNQLR